MNTFRILLITILALFNLNVNAKAPVFSLSSPLIKPHRIIRTCCSFGSDMQLFAIPGIKLTEITSLDKIGAHHYLGDVSEENGIIYTRKGGFIDMAHLRDQSDWMAYLYLQLIKNREKGNLSLILGHEGGEKILTAHVPLKLTDLDLIHLAGKIAYDLSVWHEIATWFGASSIPFVPERYSSFSIEDPYSNLLGVTIGIKALQSELPYEEAVTKIIAETLNDLDVVVNEAETYMAMEDVRNIWWTNEKRLPSGKILLQRQLQVYPCLLPWLVPGWAKPNQKPTELNVPEYASTGKPYISFYQLEFKLNHKFPFRKMFPDRKGRSITQNDFDCLLAQIATELTESDSQFR
ncbi:MAG TPA: DUF4056 domain-containing protein [Prolixibacteraceae bacterium]|nr:DUF4056 domain-containing protein [Prolixibacteraceae bacterium]